MKKKCLTITVPCYNSEGYLKRCVDSLLEGGEDVEIILVDDGSQDGTGRIADEYAAAFPDIVRVVHKENGGHGSGVNVGMELACGEYFKVVDSDDWLDREALHRLVAALRFWSRSQNRPDLVVCNYVYDHLEEGCMRSVHYRNVFPEGQLCGWEQIGHFGPSQYLVMHALVYRTGLLRDCGLRLPEHTFYVDNLFANQPLPFVERIYYMDMDLYHYYLGREDQSVNEAVLIRRIDQQIRVTQLVSRCTDLRKLRERQPRLANYLCRNISIMMAISSVHLLLAGTAQARQQRDALWASLKKQDRELYYRLKYGTVSGLTDLPGAVGRGLTVSGYRLAKKIWQFQ
ncbi:MAG: glycosyltransferase family A protein [Eubacteriales bacterium]|nr:glycosyltransferase family A protein [Eubacteriales bacterium]